MRNATTWARARRGLIAHALVATGLALSATTAEAQLSGSTRPINDPRYLVLPSVPGWFEGKIALYVSTDTSDAGVAAASPKLNYVPRLAAAANTDAVDDIYAVTNFPQSNVVPSAPQPAGPTNANAAYTPLWQVTTVTWKSGTHPKTLRSEAEVLAARDSGLVTLNKTNIIVNCSIIYTPSGGKLPGAHVVDVNG